MLKKGLGHCCYRCYFAAAPTVGEEYGADATGLFNASGVGTFKVKVEYGTNKITGAVNNGMKYFCTVVAI